MASTSSAAPAPAAEQAPPAAAPLAPDAAAAAAAAADDSSLLGLLDEEELAKLKRLEAERERALAVALSIAIPKAIKELRELDRRLTAQHWGEALSRVKVGVFGNDVDVAALGDYLDIVSQPMSLDEMDRRYERCEYPNTLTGWDAMAAHAKLIADNCRAYNREGEYANYADVWWRQAAALLAREKEGLRGGGGGAGRARGGRR